MKRYLLVTVGVVVVLAVTMLIKTRDPIVTYITVQASERVVTDYKNKKPNDDLYKYLKPPNSYRQMASVDTKFAQAHQDEVVYEIFPKEGGFFIEMGAFNGVQLSNTLWLERKHNWTGLLIEANPGLCSEIDKAQRTSWRLCACVSTDKTLTFIPGGALGGAKNDVNGKYVNTVQLGKEITVPCFSLQRVLEEINVHKIDFFSLDVEGAEMFILGTIKDDLKSGKIAVGVWTIEYRVYDGQKNLYSKSKDNLAKLRTFFQEVGGYVEHSQLDQFPRTKVIPDGESLDVVFVNIKIWCETHTELPNKIKCA